MISNADRATLGHLATVMQLEAGSIEDAATRADLGAISENFATIAGSSLSGGALGDGQALQLASAYLRSLSVRIAGPSPVAMSLAEIARRLDRSRGPASPTPGDRSKRGLTLIPGGAG